MAMSRKHYVLIAATIKRELAKLPKGPFDDEVAARQAARSMATALADTLEDMNDRFDIDRFKAACGLTD